MGEARTVLVVVTEFHITTGLRCSRNACPVAMAIYRSADAAGVDVVPGSVDVEQAISLREYTGDGAVGPETGPRLQVETPPEVGSFIYRFDRGEAVKPFAFRLVLPPAEKR